MATAFGKKSGTPGTGRAGSSGAAVKPQPSWRDKAGPQHQAITEGIHGFLVESHSGERGLHVQLALNGIGRLAGFAAQYVVWQKATGAGDPCAESGAESGAEADRELTVALMLGRPHRYTPQVNAYILPGSDGKVAVHGTGDCLWSLVGAAVTATGGQPLDQAQVQEIFDRARLAVGAGAAGGNPADLSLCQWPIVKCLLLGYVDFEGTRRAVLPLAPIHWPLALAEVAGRMIGEAKGQIDPAAAMRIVMEAAVPATMIDPKHVPATVEAAQALARSQRETASRRHA